jgi:hypothetical protein
VTAVGLVFSRDRPLQLDGALRSLYRHCRDVDQLRLAVLYRATSRAHRAAYALLEREHAARTSVSFVAESEFEQDVRAILAGGGDPGAAVHLLMVDDVVFVRPFSIGEAAALLGRRPHLLGLSLRLGRNTGFSQPRGEVVALPEMLRLEGVGDDELLEADWVSADGDYGYPFDLSCSVYRGEDVHAALTGIGFDGPNSLEHKLWLCRERFAGTAPSLAFFARARGFSVPANRVQRAAPNPTTGRPHNEPAALLGAFRRGWRLDTDAYAGFSPPTCHFEIELLLRRIEPTVDSQAAP